MSFHKVITTLFFVFIVIAGASAVSAQWRFLGSEEVNWRTDKDTLNVTGLRGDFRSIQLRVSNAPVRFDRVTVTYGNGRTEEINVRQLIRAGGRTRAIDLSGRERIIRRVDLWYQSASLGRRKARVSLYGRD